MLEKNKKKKTLAYETLYAEYNVKAVTYTQRIKNRGPSWVLSKIERTN